MVEMLVVVGIIVVAVSICMPAIMSARRSARITVCLNNLNQLGQLYAIYASANHERIPLGTSVQPPQPWPDYHTALNQYVWVNGAPSACAGPLLASLTIKQAESSILYCPLETIKTLRYDLNKPLIDAAFDHQPVTIQSSYAVRPIHALWTHNADHTVTYPFPMTKFVRLHNYALMAEHPQVLPYSHERHDGDAQINVLYSDASVRPLMASKIKKQVDAYIAAGNGMTDASDKIAINEDDKTADTIWRIIDDN